MTKVEAQKLVGNQPKTCLANMAFALTLSTYKNTPDDWRRLEAAVIVLGRSAPKRAKEIVNARKNQVL